MSVERRPLAHLIGAVTDRDWRDMKQLAQTGLFPSSEAARQFVRKYRHELVVARKGRRWLVDLRSLNRLLEAQARSA
jgi:hypothetical protein